MSKCKNIKVDLNNLVPCYNCLKKNIKVRLVQEDYIYPEIAEPYYVIKCNNCGNYIEVYDSNITEVYNEWNHNNKFHPDTICVSSNCTNCKYLNDNFCLGHNKEIENPIATVCADYRIKKDIVR